MAAQKNTSAVRQEFINDIRLITACLSIIVVALVGLAFHYLSPILKPLFIALFVYFLARPAANFLVRCKIPYWIAHFLTLALLIGLFVVMGFTVYHNISLFEQKIPEYRPKLTTILNRISQKIETSRLLSFQDFSWIPLLDQGKIPESLVESLKKSRELSSKLLLETKKKKQQWLLTDEETTQKFLIVRHDATIEVYDGEHRFDLAVYLTENLFDKISLGQLIQYLFGTIMGFLGNLLIVSVYLVFIILEAQKLPKRIERAFSRKMGETTLEIGRNVSQGINNYLLIKTGVSLATGITAGIVMVVFQLDYWVLWACLTFMANFIPYIGSMAACLFPTLLAFLQFIDDPFKALILGLLLFATQLFWGSFLDPYLSGKHLNVSPLILLFLLAYWGWLWGIIGMVLAFPLAVAIRILLLNIERTKQIAILMSSE